MSPITPKTIEGQSDSSSSSLRKSRGESSGKKKKKTDKNGEDLVKDEDLEVLGDLGAGNGGTVTRVWNKKRNTVMARKVGGGCSFPTTLTGSTQCRGALPC